MGAAREQDGQIHALSPLLFKPPDDVLINAELGKDRDIDPHLAGAPKEFFDGPLLSYGVGRAHAIGRTVEFRPRLVGQQHSRSQRR